MHWKGDGKVWRWPGARSFRCFRNRIPRVRSCGRDRGGRDRGHGFGYVRYGHGDRSRKVKASEDCRVHGSGGDRSVLNGRTDPNPRIDRPPVRAPAEGLQQERRAVVPRSPLPRPARGVLFPALGPRAEVGSDGAIQN